MSGFDLDNLLKDLGLGAGKSAGGQPTPANEPRPVGDAPGPAPTLAAAPAAPPLAPPPASPPREPAGAALAPTLVRSDPLAGARAAEASLSRPEVGILGPEESVSLLWSPPRRTVTREPAAAQLVRTLVERGDATPDKVNTAETVVKKSPGRTMRSALVEMGVPDEAIVRVLAELNDMPFERVDPATGFDVMLAKKLGLEYCRASNVLPLRREGERIVVGTANPEDVFLLDEVRRKLGGRTIRHVLVLPADIALAVELQAEPEAEEVTVDEILADIDEADVEVVATKEQDVDAEEASGSPVIRYVNYIIQSAVKDGASDIHIEPGEKKLKVRYRIDGVLFDAMTPPHKMHAAIISRLKIMANLDISERRLPQDGRIRAVVGGRKLDLRVSTLPSVAGEKCVMRILDTRSISIGLDQLGFSPDTLTIWRRQIESPHGIILVTGPTGSGKTTTLYSSLKEMDARTMNISTVEDPVEYHLDGITQVQTHEKIGMTFSAALRALLRQDPDVVMLGEIRDTDTARIAVQASLTGHLVLSTLHTNDAPSSVTRLINIGVEPFLIGAALNGVLAQRLVRRVCPNCRQPTQVEESMAEFMTMNGIDPTKAFKGKGCERCRQTGYSGRVGIYELLVLDDVTRDKVASNPSVTEFRRMCVERGMVTLRQDGLMKVAAGLTTVDEVLQATEATI